MPALEELVDCPTTTAVAANTNSRTERQSCDQYLCEILLKAFIGEYLDFAFLDAELANHQTTIAQLRGPGRKPGRRSPNPVDLPRLGACCGGRRCPRRDSPPAQGTRPSPRLHPDRRQSVTRLPMHTSPSNLRRGKCDSPARNQTTGNARGHSTREYDRPPFSRGFRSPASSGCKRKPLPPMTHGSPAEFRGPADWESGW